MTSPQHTPPHKHLRTPQEILKIAKLVETHGRDAAAIRLGLKRSTISNIVVKANRMKKAAAAS